jgi:hypothetical protein
MIQMLQIQEHTATIFSAAIVCHVKHFRTDTLLERIIKYESPNQGKKEKCYSSF